MAEIEFSVLTRACLQGRNPDETALQLAINAYEAERNAAGATINWRFNTQDARAKLHRLYPFNSKIDRVLEAFRILAWLLFPVAVPGVTRFSWWPAISNYPKFNIRHSGILPLPSARRQCARIKCTSGPVFRVPNQIAHAYPFNLSLRGA